MGEEGIEPSRAKAHRILSPARLPIPPPAQLVGTEILYYTYRDKASIIAILDMNPLFTNDDQPKKASKKKDAGYIMPNRHGRKIQPLNEDLIADTPIKKPHMPGVSDHETPKTPHHGLTQHSARTAKTKDSTNSNPAAELIRRKLETLYHEEPDTKQEQQIVENEQPTARSKHQMFMHALSTSGKSLAQIQTEWHEYYVSLPDHEKHEVWQEFYAHNSRQQPASAVQPSQPLTVTQQPTNEQPAVMPANPVMQAINPVASEGAPNHVNPLNNATNMVVVSQTEPEEKQETVKPHSRKAAVTKKAAEARQKSKAALKRQIEKRVNMSAAKQAKAMQHFKSLMFGIVSGVVVLVIVLFGLFNEMVIAPFIQPSSTASATPIILSQDGIAPSSTPEVIIPKINVQIPTDYSLTSNSEEEVQKGLEGGIVHYPTTVRPGQKGNAAYFGHSSNNIFNPGKYKFAFVKLHELVPGDIFYLTYEGKVYSYKVFDKQVVSPTQVSVLNNVEGKTATAALITCDPPGTALNRLVVWGEQISPDPNTAVDATPSQPADVSADGEQKLTGNGPSLWSRIVNWVSGNEQ